MAHPEQQAFFQSVKDRFAHFFTDVKILDIGSLDINGNTKHFFQHPYYYIGLDLAEGPNVNIVCPAHLYDCGFKFDVVTSGECFEHDMYYARSLNNMVNLLRPGGLMMFTCASDGRFEHGTLTSNPQHAPFLSQVSEEWASYYKNLNERDIRKVLDVNNIFSLFEFQYRTETGDLYFWGIKK